MNELKKLAAIAAATVCVFSTITALAAPDYDKANNAVNADASDVQTVLVTDKSESEYYYIDTASSGLTDVSRLLLIGEKLDAGEYIVRIRKLNGDVSNAYFTVDAEPSGAEETEMTESGRSEVFSMTVEGAAIEVSDRGYRAESVNAAKPVITVSFTYEGKAYVYTEELETAFRGATIGIQINNVPTVISDMKVTIREAE